jgi:hypothetical protein
MKTDLMPDCEPPKECKLKYKIDGTFMLLLNILIDSLLVSFVKLCFIFDSNNVAKFHKIPNELNCIYWCVE